MSTKKETPQRPPEAQKPTVPPENPAALVPRPNLLMTRGGFDIRDIDQAWRFAGALAESTIVPDTYRKKPSDCLVALDLAGRLGASWLAIMQNVYPVHGRPGMMSALVISLINSSGLFTDPLDYEDVGDDAEKPDFKVRAFARRKSTGKVLYGPWITWKLIKAEGWDKDKNGMKSKWITMPDQMFHYRAASWFANRHCPEVKMGMMTVEEAEDTPPSRHIESQVVEPGNEGLKKLLAQREQKESVQTQEQDDRRARREAAAGVGSPPEQAEPESPPELAPEGTEQPEPTAPEEPDEQTQAKVAEQKARLQTAGVGGGNGKKGKLF